MFIRNRLKDCSSFEVQGLNLYTVIHARSLICQVTAFKLIMYSDQRRVRSNRPNSLTDEGSLTNGPVNSNLSGCTCIWDAGLEKSNDNKRVLKFKNLKVYIASHGNPSQNGASPAIWDDIGITRHRLTRPASTPARQVGTRFSLLRRDRRLS